MSRKRYAWLGALLSCALAACGSSASNAPPGDDGPGDGPPPPHDAGGHDGSSDAPGGRTDGGIGGFQCDFIHQTSCGANEKCDLAADGRFACVRNGTLGDFQVCDDTMPNACTAGFTCSSTFFAAHRCTRLCSQLEDQCRSNEPCEREHTTSDNKQFLTCVTHEECNPISDDCTTPGTHCTYLLTISACRKPGTVPDGDVCQLRADDTQDCVQGSACVTVGPGTAKKCVKLCDPSARTPTCSAGATCLPFTTVGPQSVGTCSLP
jgi:hypothetical protein